MQQQEGSRQGGYFRRHTNPPVFFISAILAIAFVLWGVLSADSMATVANSLFTWINTTFGWLYILAVTGFLVFVIVLMVTRFGRIKLGPDDARKEFGTFSWIAMMFTAGMGIGLVFFSVAEPIGHFTNEAAPVGQTGTPGAALEAMVITFFHWGLHPWAVYIVLGLSLAYFAFRRGLPLKPASALYPLIGDRIHGPIGHLIDILAVFGTLFGLAASLGLGASQINTGLNSVFGISEGALPQVIIIAAITAVAVGSLMLGIHGGIRRLSVGTIVLAGLLALFVLIVGPTVMILQFLASSAGAYLQQLPELSLQMFAFNGETGASGWLGSWTLFYWGWWISWSPFVGMFIARISYGYTIRQFIAGMLFIPTGMSMVWFAIFGGTGLQYVLSGQGGGLTEAGTTGALFVLMNQLPIGGIIAAIASLLGVLVVALFFATSSDSGSLVVDILTNGGDPNPIWQQRMFWAVTEGAIAAILLVAGWAAADSASAALQPLQTAAVASGLPFAIVLILLAWGLVKGLSEDRAPEEAPAPTPEPGRAASRPTGAASPQQASALDQEERGQGRT